MSYTKTRIKQSYQCKLLIYFSCKELFCLPIFVKNPYPLCL